MKFAKNTLRISLLLENSSRIFDQDDPPPPSTLFCIFLRMTNISGKIFSPSSCFATKSCKKTFSGFRKLLRRIGRPSSIPSLSKKKWSSYYIIKHWHFGTYSYWSVLQLMFGNWLSFTKNLLVWRLFEQLIFQLMFTGL